MLSKEGKMDARGETKETDLSESDSSLSTATSPSSPSSTSRTELSLEERQKVSQPAKSFVRRRSSSRSMELSHEEGGQGTSSSTRHLEPLEFDFDFPMDEGVREPVSFDGKSFPLVRYR
jgi:hypothetical protein